jgi:hypothetical protein
VPGDALQNELDALVDKPLFHQYNNDVSAEDLDNLNSEEAVMKSCNARRNRRISLTNRISTIRIAAIARMSLVVCAWISISVMPATA